MEKMTKWIEPPRSNKFFANEQYGRKFGELGRYLDEKLAVQNNLWWREEAAMDIIFAVVDLMLKEIIKSFIPTIGIDCSVTRVKIKNSLKRHSLWISNYDMTKFQYLKSLYGDVR